MSVSLDHDASVLTAADSHILRLDASLIDFVH